MVCFWYVTVNTLHKGDNKDDDDDNDNNNNNNNSVTLVTIRKIKVTQQDCKSFPTF